MDDIISASDLKAIKSAILKHKARHVAVQIPEGLKTRALEIADSIESLGVLTVIIADPCYGACDVPAHDMKMLGCDLIVHFAHSRYLSDTELPVVYVEYRIGKDPIGILKKEMSRLSGIKHLGLITTIQYMDHLEKVSKYLNDQGIETYRGKPSLATYPGQVLGCDQSAAKDIHDKVDAYLYIGTGKFHPLGVARALDKPVYCLDVENQEMSIISEDEKRKYDSKLYLRKVRFDEARAVGIIATTKAGQMDRNIFSIKKEIEMSGKKAYIISMHHISPGKILGMDLDILVNTACPRIEEDLIYDIPVINWSTIKGFKSQ